MGRFDFVVQIELVDDNEPMLLLDGAEGEVNFSTTYSERQPYLSNPTVIPLSRDLAIRDLDVGKQFLIGANITILGNQPPSATNLNNLSLPLSLSRCYSLR